METSIFGADPMPEAFRGFLKRIDTLLPDVLSKHARTLEQLFDVDFLRAETTPFHRTVVGANALLLARLAEDFAEQVTWIKDPATIGAIAYASIKASDVVCFRGPGLLAAYEIYPGMRDQGVDRRAHPFRPAEISQWEDGVSVGEASVALTPMATILVAFTAAKAGELGVEAALLTLAVTLSITPILHEWAHLPKPHRLVELAQPSGRINFASVGVDPNRLLDWIDFPRYVERAIYLITEQVRGPGKGVEPVSWQEHPELKAWKLPAAERRAALRAARIARYDRDIERAAEAILELRLSIRDAPTLEKSTLLAQREGEFSRMLDQLATLKDPARLDAVKAEYDRVYAELARSELKLGKNARARAKETLTAKLQELSKRLGYLVPALG